MLIVVSIVAGGSFHWGRDNHSLLHKSAWGESVSIDLITGSITDCTETNLSQALAANGFTHLLVRRDTAEGQIVADHPAPAGLRVAARFDDGEVFEVTAPPPSIYTANLTGFLPREHDAEWSWRWIGADAAWTIVNTGPRPIVATLGLEMAAFHRARGIELLLDGRRVQALVVGQARRVYQLGPLTVFPGDHQLTHKICRTSNCTGIRLLLLRQISR